MIGLVAQDLSMVYKTKDESEVEALRNISFRLKPGQLLSVLGPSGCGKTTLLNIIAGFLAPTNGSIALDGVEIVGPGSERGMVFQQGALFEWMTVEENVGFGPRMMGKPKSESRDKVAHWLNMVGLTDFAKKPVYQLSGGMQQRVALARCLVNEPKLILMDEPLGALDALTREKMQGLVLRLWRETGKTIVLITHSVEEALLLGEQMFVMAPRPGRIEKIYELPFAERGLSESPRVIKGSPEFVRTREEVLKMIWSMEEEIMGR